MPLIELSLGLAFNGVELIRHPFTKANASENKVHVDAPCVNGTYNGDLLATVTFPAGSIPPAGYGHAGSGDVSVTACPN